MVFTQSGLVLILYFSDSSYRKPLIGYTVTKMIKKWTDHSKSAIRKLKPK